MILWWMGNLVLLLVVAPAVVVLANRVLSDVRQVNTLADVALAHGVGITEQLDTLPALGRTRELTSAALQLVGRYGAALRRIL